MGSHCSFFQERCGCGGVKRGVLTLSVRYGAIEMIVIIIKYYYFSGGDSVVLGIDPHPPPPTPPGISIPVNTASTQTVSSAWDFKSDEGRNFTSPPVGNIKSRSAELLLPF